MVLEDMIVIGSGAAEKMTWLDAYFKAWLLQCRRKIPSASSSAKAIDDTLKRWAALIHYPNDGL